MAVNGIPTSFSECVLKTPLTVAVNLRYTDSNGDTVDKLYPNDYTSLIGSNVSTLKEQYQQVTQILETYGTEIADLDTRVTALESSASTFMLYVTGTCLYSNDGLPHPIDDAVNRLMGNTCSYNAVLGTPTQLSNAVAAQCNNLNTLPAFSQNSVMSGLSGWVTSPTTIADSENNQWLAYCDARTGISNALAAITPTCSQVVIDYQAVLGSSMVFNLFFSGYSFIPSGFTDNGSIVRITDSGSGVYQTSFDIVAKSTDTNPLVLATSGSTLSPTSSYYTVQVTSKVQNTTLGLSCEKTMYKTVTSTESLISPYDIGNFTLATSGTTAAITFESSLNYTPSAILIIPKNQFTGTLFADQNYGYWIEYIAGGGKINFAGSPTGGTLNFDYISYR